MPVDEVEREHDAVRVYGGMGAPGYIAVDGRILIGPDELGDEPVVREANDDEMIAILVIGAKVTRIDELLELVPAAPTDAMMCPLCGGSRWWHMPGAAHSASPIICLLCRGRSWATQAMIDARPDITSLL